MNESQSINPERLDLCSLDISGEKREELLSLFPEVRTEGGKIDFERLKAVLGEMVDAGRERYGMNWPGKAECMRTIQAPSMGTLLPLRAESVDWDTTENVIIEGDNLEVLKLLQKSYLGKVKMIYIDPPYNTGNDFIYPDNFTESLQTYLEYSGQVDNEGRKFGTNADTDGRYHSKWLNMMFPRLYLSRNLLADDGVVFISCDDNEVHNLRNLVNEIFGEENFVATIVWEKRKNRENRKVVSSRHEYVLCAARNALDADAILSMLPMSGEALARYKNPDNDPRGSWKSDPATAQAGHGTKSQFYEITAPNGNVHRLPSGRCWVYTETAMREAIADGRIWFGRDGNGVPRIKTYLESKDRGLTPESIWFANEVSTNEQAKNALKSLFDGEAVFDTPKPVELVRQMLKIAASDGIVLDFFAGSGTTAHAVLEQNAEDGGDRKYILVQLPEPVESKDYNTIAEIARARIARAASNLSRRQPKLGDSGKRMDCGFRSFQLASSNFIPWDGIASNDADQLAKQLLLGVEHTREDRKPEDLLFEILLKSWGEPALSLKTAEVTIEGVRVFSIADGAFLICLEQTVSLEFIRVLAARKPDRVVMRESAFVGNDQLKANAVQTFKAAGVTSFKVV